MFSRRAAAGVPWTRTPTPCRAVSATRAVERALAIMDWYQTSSSTAYRSRRSPRSLRTRPWLSRNATALEMEAGLTWRRSTSSAAVRLPESLMHREAITRAIILGVPDCMKTVVSVSSYARTASASRPCSCAAARGPRGAACLRRWARCSVARWARSER